MYSAIKIFQKFDFLADPINKIKSLIIKTIFPISKSIKFPFHLAIKGNWPHLYIISSFSANFVACLSQGRNVLHAALFMCCLHISAGLGLCNLVWLLVPPFSLLSGTYSKALGHACPTPKFVMCCYSIFSMFLWLLFPGCFRLHSDFPRRGNPFLLILTPLPK